MLLGIDQFSGIESYTIAILYSCVDPWNLNNFLKLISHLHSCLLVFIIRLTINHPIIQLIIVFKAIMVVVIIVKVIILVTIAFKFRVVKVFMLIK